MSDLNKLREQFERLRDITARNAVRESDDDYKPGPEDSYKRRSAALDDARSMVDTLDNLMGEIDAARKQFGLLKNEFHRLEYVKHLAAFAHIKNLVLPLRALAVEIAY